MHAHHTIHPTGRVYRTPEHQQQSKSKMMKFSFSVIFFICASVACGEAKFQDIFKRQSSKEEFSMLITENGKRYKEKIIFDMSKKVVVHDVPSHGNISKSNVMTDFVSNSTITRFPDDRVCYIQPRNPEGPPLDVLRKSMEKASSGKYKIRSGFRRITIQWRVKGLADLTKQSKEVLDFCRGMHIYEVEEYSKDGSKVVRASDRNKRQTSDDDPVYVLCHPWQVVSNDLKKCPRAKWILKCKFLIKNCFHYVVCINNAVSLRDGNCTSTHKFNDFTCCSPTCP